MSKTALFLIAALALLADVRIANSTPSEKALADSACPKAEAGYVTCHLRHPKHANSSIAVIAGASSAIAGLGPADLQSAYKYDVTQGVGKIVAIVEPYDDPNAESDLAIYRAQFGLAACTTANGCFRKLNQTGQLSPLPTPDAGWAQILSLSLDVISAVCPNCNILLVEANSNSGPDVDAAIDQAAGQLGVTAISINFGSDPDEFDANSCLAHYTHPGIAIAAETDDGGYGDVVYPADCPYVTAVGGTTLQRDSSSRGWSETVWNTDGEASSSGCAIYIAKPPYQTDTGCAKRTVNDVAAVADPDTGFAMYDSYQVPPVWTMVGGTGLSSALIAAVYALAGPAGPSDFPVTYAYANPGALFDITHGTNSSSQCTTYLCMAQVGYDAPSGNGTPNGVGAFQPLANFSMSLSPSNGTLSQGTSGTVGISTTSLTNVSQTLALTASGLPTGVAAVFAPQTINAGGASTLTLTAATTAAPGNYNVTVTAQGASQSVNAVYALGISQTIPVSTTTTLLATPNPSSTGQAIALTALVGAASGTPTGSVSFYDGTTLLGTSALTGGTASLSTALAPGVHSLTASYLGVFGFNASQSTTLSQTVLPAGPLSPMGLRSSPNPSTYQQAVTIISRVSASRPKDPVPSGSVTFTSGATPLGVCTLSASAPRAANCSISVATLAVGVSTITATYGGDANYPTQTASLPQTVNAAASVTRVEVSPKNSLFGTSADLVAFVLEKPDHGAIAAGSVSFFSNGAAIGTAELNSGVAVLPYVFPSTGTFVITASYSGSAAILTSTSNPVNAVVRLGRQNGG